MAAARIAIDTFRYKGQPSGDAVAEHNRMLFAAQQRRRRGPTPEVFFDKRLDNSRLVKADDPVRKREMRSFSIAAVLLFALLMGYSWQHFRSVEDGYQIEAQKAQLQRLQDQNHQLGLAEAQLTRSERIDRLAHKMGLETPQPGQIVTAGSTDAMPGAPVLAQVMAPRLQPAP